MRHRLAVGLPHQFVIVFVVPFLGFEEVRLNAEYFSQRRLMLHNA
jgi:hypothetical protein